MSEQAREMSEQVKEEQEAAWGVPVREEPRWPAWLTVITALLLYIALPDKFAIRPIALVPSLEGALLLSLVLAHPYRHTLRQSIEFPVVRFLSLALTALVSAANFYTLALLLQALVTHGKFSGGAVGLLTSSLNIWVTNVLVFALWYWELDRGGPGARSSSQHRQPDFLFPQMVTPHCAPPGWTPNFIDYLYVAFTNATAFSPTDTMPLTPSAKLLMTAQSFASLLTVALVAARAVNILA
jgi:hypothetical protein